MVFKNKYGELRSGWSIAVYLALALVVGQLLAYFVSLLFLEFVPLHLVAEISGIITQAITIGITLLVFRIVYMRPFSAMGLAREGWVKGLLAGCAFGAASMGAVFGILALSGQAAVSFTALSSGDAQSIVMYLVLFIGVGFSEETMTRGYIMTALKTMRNKYVVFFAPAIGFSLLHLANPNVSLPGLVNISIVGLLFAYMVVRSGKLWLPIGYHITWNFFQGNVFGMNVSGVETSSIIKTEFVGNDWITGGAFGAEGGLVTTAVLLLGFVFVRYAIKIPAAPVWTYDSDLPLIRGKKNKDIRFQEKNSSVTYL